KKRSGGKLRRAAFLKWTKIMEISRSYLTPAGGGVGRQAARGSASSPAFESGRAFLLKRGHPFAAILRHGGQRTRQRFERRPGRRAQSAVDGLLGELYRQRRVGSNLRGQFPRPVEQLAARHNLVDQPPAFGGGGVDARAGENHLFGPPCADDLRQALCAAPAGDRADVHFR